MGRNGLEGTWLSRQVVNDEEGSEEALRVRVDDSEREGGTGGGRKLQKRKDEPRGNEKTSFAAWSFAFLSGSYA